MREQRDEGSREAPVHGAVARRGAGRRIAAGLAVLIFAVAWWFVDGGRDPVVAPPGLSEQDAADVAPPPEPAETAGEERAPLVAEPVPVDETAPAIATVCARFVDQHGSPVAGVALCRIADKDSERDYEEQPDRDPTRYAGVRAESGADGRVVLEVPRTEEDSEPGAGDRWEATLATRSSRFAPRWTEAVVSAGRVTHLGTLRLVAAGTVIGHVRDDRGQPLAGFEVTARANADEEWTPTNAVRHRLDRAEVVRSETAVDGSYRLESVPARLAILSVEDEERTVSVEPGGVLEVDFDLPWNDQSGDVRCVVVDPEGRPVPSAFWETDEQGRTVDSNGTFYLPRTPSGVLESELSVDDETHLHARRTFPVGTPLNTLRRITLERAEQIEIQVRDEEGQPVTLFAVWLEAESPGFQHGIWDHRSVAGTCRIPRPTQPFEVCVWAPCFEEAYLGPFEPSTVVEPIVATLRRRPGVVSGRVTFEGRPVAGARILFAAAGEGIGIQCLGFACRSEPVPEIDVVCSDEQGQFRTPLCWEGQYFVRAEAAGFAPGEAGPIHVQTDAGAAGVEIVLCRGGTLRGRVLAPPDVDPTGMIVGISRGDGFPKTQRIAPDGTYEFTDLTPGPWQVAPRQFEIDPSPDSIDQYLDLDGPDLVPAIVWDCEVLSGKVTTFDLDLRGSGDAVLRGRIEVIGLPGAQAWTVRAVHEDSPETTAWQGGIAADGSFLLRSARIGRHRVVIITYSGPLSPMWIETHVDLAPGENSWSLSFATASLEVRTTAPRYVLNLVHRQVRSADTIFLSSPLFGGYGTLSQWLVPAGRGQIVEWGDQGSPDLWPVLAEVEVPAGGEARVEIE